MPPAFVHRITKYDPADRDEHGHYTGTEDTAGDCGPVEAAYLAAVSAFAEESGVDRLEIRDPEVRGFVHFGAEPPVAVTVHVGWDQYVYVGSDRSCAGAVARTRELGLFPEPLTASPYAAESDEAEVTEPADAGFWTRVRTALASRHALLLEENHVRNAARWHRITPENLDTVRAGLGPRALLRVWPDLTPDVGAVLAALSDEEESVEFVWEAQDGTISHVIVDDTGTGHRELAARVADARAACVLPLSYDGHRPLLCAVLPDSDGVLRARW
ncbi:RNA-binding protein [Streptomyces sp. NPDC057552]|uniref:RNA-binding protein n=1 Tax=Streptomyces sp. NPDC057552 TaxID=3350537 RepID=UPI0036B2B636